MSPASPVVPGAQLAETVYAKDQPEYQPLPVFRFDDGTVLTRWRLTFWERLRVLWTGNVYLWQLTFNRPLQPVMLEASKPALESLPKGKP